MVVLDPHFGSLGVTIAFFGPLAVGMLAKDILEPLLIGHSTSLTPVAVLLAVMVWGSIWGVTGMVLAVPMTAVGRLYMEGLDHPLPNYVAALLAGRTGSDSDDDPDDDPDEATHAQIRERAMPPSAPITAPIELQQAFEAEPSGLAPVAKV